MHEHEGLLFAFKKNLKKTHLFTFLYALLQLNSSFVNSLLGLYIFSEFYNLQGQMMYYLLIDIQLPYE